MPADKYFRAPRTDRRHRLACKAASIFHSVLGYPSYKHYDEGGFNNSLALITVAIFVGALQSLVSNASEGLPAFAWTLDPKRTQGLAEHLADAGLSPRQLILQASRVWGGFPPKHSPYIGENGHVVGMICTEITIVLDVIRDPSKLALHGLDKGLITFHRGSTPMLPQERTAGFILAGKPDTGRSSTISADEKLETEKENDGNLIITTEPTISEKGYPSVVLCMATWRRCSRTRSICGANKSFSTTILFEDWPRRV